MALFILLYKVVLTFESVDETLKCEHSKCIEHYFLVVLFIMLESVHEILKCDHSNECHWAVLSCGAVYYAIQGGSDF